MRKAERLFQIVNLVRAHQPVTAAQLAERLNVSIRTVYRYIDDLSASGIPIYGETGLGYALLDKFELPPLSLTRDEMEALILSVNMLSRSASHELEAVAQSLLAKIQAASPLDFNRSTVVTALSLAARPINMCYWEKLHRGIKAQHCLSITYLSLVGERSERTVLPLGLFYWGGKWTVGTWCFSRQAFREFRVDLIEKIAVVEKQGVPKLINLKAYMRHQSNMSSTLIAHH